MRCTPLFCPVGTTARDGVCVRFVDNLIGYTVAVAMEIEQATDSGQNKSSIDFNIFARELRSFVLQTLNRGSVSCTFCNLFVHLHLETGTIYVTIHLSSTQACTETDLLRGISNILNLNMYFPETQMFISLKHFDFDKLMNDINNGLLDRPEKIIHLHCFQNVIFYTPDMIYCPSISLSPEEIREYRYMYTRNTIDMIMSNATEFLV